MIPPDRSGYGEIIRASLLGAMELYERLGAAKRHGKAAVAVARHLAEASWWVLTKRQPYREPNQARMSSSMHG